MIFIIRIKGLSHKLFLLGTLLLYSAAAYAQLPNKQASINIMRQLAQELNARCPEKEGDYLIMKSVKYNKGRFYCTFRNTDPDVFKTENSRIYWYVMIKYAFASDLAKIVFDPQLKDYFSVVKPSFSMTTYNRINHITHVISYNDVVAAKQKTDRGEYAWPSKEEMTEEYVRKYAPIHEVDSMLILVINEQSRNLPSEICDGLTTTNTYLSLDRVWTLEFMAKPYMIEDEETYKMLKFAIIAQLGRIKNGIFWAAMRKGEYSMRYVFKNQDDGTTLTDVTFTPTEINVLYNYFKDVDLGVFE